jgi:pilus assembly protein CpaF
MRLRDLVSRRPKVFPGVAGRDALIELEEAVRARVAEQLHGGTPPLGVTEVRPLVASALEEVGSAHEVPSAEDRELLLDHVCEMVVDFGPLHELVADPEVTTIVANGPYDIFLERKGQRERWDWVWPSPQHMRHTIERLLRLNPGKRLDDQQPIVDLSLPDGGRVTIVIPPAAADGPQLTLRKYLSRFRSLRAFEEAGSLSLSMSRFLEAAVRSRLGVLISGASGSGKTTLMEALARYIGERERIITIEDTPEMHLEQPDVVRLLTRAANIEGAGVIDTQDLFRASLRMRADRILLGEIRGGEALDFLQACNSGHLGSLAVLHASTAQEAVVRLQQLVQYSRVHLPLDVLRQQIVDGLDLVVQIDKHSDGVRRVTEVSEILGVGADGRIQLAPVFLWVVERDAAGRMSGSYQGMGRPPACLSRLELAGYGLPEAFFGTAD